MMRLKGKGLQALGHERDLKRTSAWPRGEAKSNQQMHNPAESGLGETGRELHHHGLQQQAEAEGWSQEQSSRLRGKVALAPIWLQCSGVHGGYHVDSRT